MFECWGVGEMRLGFPDLWSGHKPWWNCYLTPVVNFGEAQLAKSTLLTSTLVPLEFFRSFKVRSEAKERVGCGKQGWATSLSIPSKTAAWFLSLQWRTCPWAETLWWYIYIERERERERLYSKTRTSGRKIVYFIPK